MRDLMLLELIAVVAAAVFAFVLSVSNRANKTRAAAIISILVSLFLLAWDRYLYISTARGLLDTITCAFAPSAIPCRGANAGQGPLPAQSHEADPSPLILRRPKRDIGHANEQPLVDTQEIFLGDHNARSIWTTSVYSYAPGGGGPGGGLADDKLKVGGWGDTYLSLISIPVDEMRRRVRRATLVLHLAPRNPGSTPTPMRLMRVSEPWGWSEGDRLWWKDLPKAEFVSDVAAPGSSESAVEIDITDIYNDWAMLKRPALGVMLSPTQTDNNFNTFYSTRANVSLRPRLRLLY